MGVSLDELARGIAAGERPALARALSLAERDPAAAAALLSRLAERLGRAHVVGVTGPPGAGKSTLVGVMARHFLGMGQRVAVLAVDPSSPVSGGALLGDRFRIGEAAADERSFVRSTATRGSLGGLNGAARQMVQLMDAGGFDLVIVETVGTGQSEIDVARLTDSLLVVFPPGLGDELQAIKAGILELADLLVVTKSDTAGAKLACQSLRSASMLWRNPPPIHPVSALSGEGVAELAQAVLARGRSARAAALEVDGDAVTTALRERFEKLWDALARRLPFDPDAVVSRQWLDAAASAPAQLMLELRPGGDSFQLGAVAGALIVLATDMGLNCSMEDTGLASGSMRLRVQQGGTVAESEP